ncbi:osmotically inducible protein OsmC [Tessaracoccus bendigoensis DSM 12906]|uniref:Osmotically inducible protein OsmC n=1 Tax=Tessaracoccus bendigoensis DSM 12906 TaxID=1123357 RepID=A0A1M6IFG9_9ACTN|nr:OsmC family peroxiredoxin [Tessaracoccus bendigoensis]SHJ33066.1 osmotically inducible protein OsmC [Tessaracoccus bendigoensis DSM 12906]
MAVNSLATTTWHGSLFEGSGEVTFASSKLGTFPINWKARSEGSDSTTTPEELIAAAHASCFSMALSNGLAQNGTPPTAVQTTASVRFEPGVGITSSHLALKAVVPGLTDAQFQEISADAKANCPVSKALAGVEITLEATLG